MQLTLDSESTENSGIIDHKKVILYNKNVRLDVSELRSVTMTCLTTNQTNTDTITL